MRALEGLMVRFCMPLVSGTDCAAFVRVRFASRSLHQHWQRKRLSDKWSKIPPISRIDTRPPNSADKVAASVFQQSGLGIG
jgi:hypothetical protein